MLTRAVTIALELFFTCQFTVPVNTYAFIWLCFFVFLEYLCLCTISMEKWLRQSPPSYYSMGPAQGRNDMGPLQNYSAGASWPD